MAKRKAKATRGGTKSRTSRSTSSRKRTTKTSKRQLNLNQQQKILIVGIGVVFVTAVLILSLMSPDQGQLTAALSDLLWRGFGWGAAAVPLATGAVGLYLVLLGMEQEPALPGYRLSGVVLLFLVAAALASMIMTGRDNGLNDVWAVADAGVGGGYLGSAIASLLTDFVGTVGAVFTLLVLSVIGAILVSGLTRAELGDLLLRTVQGEFWPSLPGWGGQGDDAATAEPLAARDRDIVVNNGRTRQTISRSNKPAQATQLPLAPNREAPKPQPPNPKPQTPAPTPQPQTIVAEPIVIGGRSYQAEYRWTLPNVADMLTSGADQDTNNASIQEQVRIIEHTLESFGAPATVVEVNPGPTVTQFGVEPSFLESRGGKRTKVKVGKIASLADDLTLALASHSVRIQAPVPGKGYVGIEVPNQAKATVSLRDVIESNQFQRIKSPLRIGLGQNVSGQPVAADLASMPHLLVAGTTGSGKSVCVNGIIAGLLLQNTPDDLKLVMVDPKRVELTGYNGIPHLAAPVVVDMDRVIATLQWALREMDARYKMFAEVGARNITDFNKKVKNHKKLERLPYVVIIIDELADLMMLAPEDTERAITRLAQMARATGIHMIIATQRPSVDVVTGLIKANFPARIAFAVASSTDSRVILDTTGAERLLGQGDMLFQSPDAASPVRLQGCYVSDGELDRLIQYWKAARRYNLIAAQENNPPRDPLAPMTENPALARQPVARQSPPQPVQVKPETAVPPSTSLPAAPRPKPKPAAAPPTSNMPPVRSGQTAVANQPNQPTTILPPSGAESSGMAQKPLIEALQEAEEAAANTADYDDDLMPEAIALVRKLQKASTSLLQRRFRIGYTRAARLIDTMEMQGIIGPATGTSKARDVLLPKPEEEAD
jgi:DNA segregation ATPase FtsK/SpoIIIE, S-DNA-T family